MKIFILLLPIILSSCEAVKGIFKAGWYVGLFCAFVVIVVILLLTGAFKKRQ